MITVEEALESMSRFIAGNGLSADSEDALYYLNRARKLLYSLDDWLFTTVAVAVGVNSLRCFYPPYQIESIRRAYEYACKNQIPVHDEGYETIDPNSLSGFAGSRLTIYPSGSRTALPFNPANRKLCFRAKDSRDGGRKVNIKYQNSYGSIKSDEITLSSDFIPHETSDEVSSVDIIRKDRTYGGVDVFTYNRHGVLSERHVIHSRETNPEYRQYQLTGCSAGRIVLVGKRKFENYHKEDLDSALDLDSLDAIEFATMALYNKNKDIKAYAANIELARTHLDVFREDLNSSSQGFEPMTKFHSQLEDRFSDYR